MKKRFSFFILFLSCLAVAFAQKKADAEYLFNVREYEGAKELYGQLLDKKPKDAWLRYCYGRCLLELHDKRAEDYFLYAADKKIVKSHFYLGEIYFHDYQFEKAIEAYSAFLSETPENVAYCKMRIEQSKAGADMLRRVEDLVIIDSAFVDKKSFLSRYEISSEIGTVSFCPSSDSTTVYMSERKDRMLCAKDNNGNLDLFSSEKLLNEWTADASVSRAVNTPYDENYPFLLPDGVTLYFASNKPGGLGGYDIYMTRFSSLTNDFLPPQNMGMPFNSPANDYMLIIDEERGQGWFATDRNCFPDSVAIYWFVPNGEKTILKDVANDSVVRAFAKLQLYRTAKVVEHKTAVAVSEKTPSVQIYFVLNDAVVYTTLDDFKNEDALNAFFEMEDLEAKLDTIKGELHRKRIEYGLVQESEKELLKSDILQLEKSIFPLQRQIESKLREIRWMESK